MAFTDANKIKLVKILGVNLVDLNLHLDAYSNGITADIETEVIAQIARWEAGTGQGGTYFTATESNRGFNQYGPKVGGDPKTNIEVLLFFETASSPYQISLVRG